MNRIQVSAKFANVPRANLAQFKNVAAEAVEITNGESGVLQYDWFFNDDETVCVVLETYRDSAALLAHIATLGEVFDRLVQVGGGCELEMFGDPSDGLRHATAGLGSSVFSPYLRGNWLS
jgi:quinol monooxygenase YgiN